MNRRDAVKTTVVGLATAGVALAKEAESNDPISGAAEQPNWVKHELPNRNGIYMDYDGFIFIVVGIIKNSPDQQDEYRCFSFTDRKTHSPLNLQYDNARGTYELNRAKEIPLTDELKDQIHRHIESSLRTQQLNVEFWEENKRLADSAF